MKKMYLRCEEFYEICAERRIKLLFLPAYTPEFNPIELAFNKYKSLLRRVRPLLLQFKEGPLMRTLSRMWDKDVTGEHGSRTWCRFIRKAGYEVPDDYVD